MTKKIVAAFLAVITLMSATACHNDGAEFITTKEYITEAPGSKTDATDNTTAAPTDNTDASTASQEATSGEATTETTTAATETTTADTTTEKPAETTTDKTTVQTTTEVTTTTTEEVKPTTTPEGGPDLSDATYADMIERSLVTKGNTARMRNALEKAAKGEDITVAYIGGSITEGYMINDKSRCWASLTSHWLDLKFPDSNVTCVNAGLSGTNSSLGCVRAERDVKQSNPDIIFVEFAVNDAQDTMNKKAYESLVRGFLEMDNAPAVVLVFTVIESGYTCEAQQSFIGNYYNLPMISLNNVLREEFNAGTMVWSDYSDDESHPNYWGSALMADMIEYYLEQVIGEMNGKTQTVPALPAKAMLSDAYKNMHYADASTLSEISMGSFIEDSAYSWFKNGWVHKRNNTSANERLIFELKCSTLFLVPKVNNSASLGTIQVFVDGELTAIIAGNRSDGWNNPLEHLVFEGKESTKHTIEIKMTDATAKNMFSLCCLGYVD